MTQLFKLSPSIKISTTRQFKADNPGVSLTNGADLTEFGYAWGSTEPQPNPTSGKITELAAPVLGDGFVTVGWVTRDPTETETEEHRVRRFSHIKRSRDDAIASGISVGGVHVHTDDLSQQRLVGAALAATIDPETTINWKMADGQFATLSGTQIIGIAQAVRGHVQAAFDTEAMLRAQINAAETIEEIDAVGWPDDP